MERNNFIPLGFSKQLEEIGYCGDIMGFYSKKYSYGGNEFVKPKIIITEDVYESSNIRKLENSGPLILWTDALTFLMENIHEKYTLRFYGKNGWSLFFNNGSSVMDRWDNEEILKKLIKLKTNGVYINKGDD